jgi:hypothetical protein
MPGAALRAEIQGDSTNLDRGVDKIIRQEGGANWLLLNTLQEPGFGFLSPFLEDWGLS